ncbi:MAG: 5-(carboxyamino)imidazole ribonucleotide synthase [Anaerolineae bacterium]
MVKTIGILGSGQLGRMLAMEARRLGVKTVVFSPGSQTPAGEVADVEITADYEDLDAIQAFAEQVDAITYEFENVPLMSAMKAAERVPVLPQPQALAVSQNRLREKSFLADHGCPVAPFRAVKTLGELEQAVSELGVPCVLKTAESGYDGKGQVKILQADEAESAWETIGRKPAVLEQWVTFEKEISVVIARDCFDTFAIYGPIENVHENHILDVSVCPSSVSEATAEKTVTLAKQVVNALDIIGLICIEFFVKADGDVLVNEIAPRPHNSGHLTIEGHVTNQFEQQLRTVCGWPVGSVEMKAPAVAMANLLGDCFTADGSADLQSMLLEHGDVKAHLYGKTEARPGRKMGHLTVCGESVEEVKKKVLSAREQLKRN